MILRYDKNSVDNLKEVAVVVPVHKKELSETEKISMKHLLHFLGGYDKYFAQPEGLDMGYPEFRTKAFNKKHFKSNRAYSDLLLTREFYQRFSDYKYILIYQLDCLVFSDQLSDWCKKGYDYIGAPWFASQMVKAIHPDCCGNGGFSLRKIDTFIKVIEKAGKKPVFFVLKDFIKFEMSLLLKGEKRPRQYLKAIKTAWVNSAIHRYSYAEDQFWSFEAQKYYPDFKISPPDVGVKFAFEVGPKYCFERNNHELPFGCHNWKEYDKEFWTPYLLKQ